MDPSPGEMLRITLDVILGGFPWYSVRLCGYGFDYGNDYDLNTLTNCNETLLVL